MSIYTSYYAGIIKGEAVSISLYSPKRFQGRHLPLFAPTPELLRWWKSSVKDATAQQEYKQQFREILDSRQQLIDLWVRKQQGSSADITLLCFEKTGDFCHRHIVGREVIGRYLPDLWGGEVGFHKLPEHEPSNLEALPNVCFTSCQSSSVASPSAGISITTKQIVTESGRGIYSDDTPTNIDKTLLESKRFTPSESVNLESSKSMAFTSSQNLSFPPVIVSLLSKCHDCGYEVRCSRLSCGYYQLSLEESDLGTWTELGVLGVLGGLQQEFYRQRLTQ